MTDIKAIGHMPHKDNLLSNDVIINTKTADSSGKIIFEDPILCSQFLRDYIDIPCLKNVQHEDIEDVSDQYVPLFSEERNADRVKKVNIKDEPPFFMISLIEHKSKVDYNVTMQIFRYMTHIWDKFAREAERIQKGVTKRKDFKYYLVPLHNYSNEELLENNDEMSLVMMINKMQNIRDIEIFKNLPAQKVETILEDTSEHVLDIISKVLRTFLLKMNLPEDEAEELVGKVKEKKMGFSKEDTLHKLQTKCNISLELATLKMSLYWK